MFFFGTQCSTRLVLVLVVLVLVLDLENISIAVGIFFLGTTELEIHLGLGVILPPPWTSEGVKNQGHLRVRLLDPAVQARLLELNPRGFFTLCVCHNYNLLYSEIRRALMLCLSLTFCNAFTCSLRQLNVGSFSSCTPRVCQ